MAKRSTLIGIFSTLVISLICLILILAVWLAFDLPRQARRAFGPADPDLSTFQHLSLSARLLLQEDQLKEPSDPSGAPRRFKIEHGESTYAVTDRLESEGLIPSAAAMRDYLVYSGLDTTLQAGQFDLNPRMTTLEIAWALQDATPNEITINILPGWRLEEIAAAIPTSGLEFSSKDFLSTAYRPPQLSPLQGQIPEGVSLEGFIFPDNYRLARKTSVEDFLKTVLADFQIKVDGLMLEGFQRQGLDLYQAVTLASIVQREAVVEDEMPLIASVFLNRLNDGMKLDSDPTVQYAIGYDRKGDSWWKNPLSLDDLQVNSPYNTYRQTDLPPGPISNPGLTALSAIAFPAQSSYFYFRSACDGSGRHNFAETFEQHNLNACP